MTLLSSITGFSHELEKLAVIKTELQPHQQRVVDRIQKKDQPGLVVAHGLGSGKAEVVTNKVFTPSGHIEIGELKIGDFVISQAGLPTKVIGVFPQGKKDIYKVSFRDGVSVECCLEHLWLTKTHKDRKNYNRSKPEFQSKWIGSVKTTEEIKNSIKSGAQWNHTIPLTEPVQFESKEVPIDPYLLGLLLGDGGMAHKSLSFTSADEEIIQAIQNLIPDETTLHKKDKINYYIAKTSGYRNKLSYDLQKLGLRFKKSFEKSVPSIYKINSVEIRLGILQGLMDTDGTVSSNGLTVTFTSTSEELAKDVVFLVQSLGGTGVTTNRITKYTYKGVKKLGRRSYTVHISLPPEINPFRLVRKRQRVVPRSKYKPTRYVTAVEYVGRKDAVCIRVDNPYSLYLTENFIVTHNTLTSIAAQEALNMPADVVVPASLQGNYKKEVKKHVTGKTPKRQIQSMQNITVKGTPPTKPMMIVDEAHRARESGTKTHQVLSRNKAQKRLLLTGSPFYNHPSDIAPLVNMAAGNRVLPSNPQDFEKRYVKMTKVNPSLSGRLRGVKSGIIPNLNTKREEELKGHFGKWVDYHPGSTENFPTVNRENVEVPMTSEQLGVYETLMNKAPAWVAYKIRKGLPPNKAEAQQLNAFMSGVRQVSNSTAPFQSDEKPHDPKIQKAFENLQSHLSKNPRAKAVVYSNYLDAGINPYKQRLDKANIPYGEFTGQMDKTERDELVRQYNANKLKALLISSAGGEGLDLRGTRLMQILDPHWNDEKIKQVEGRGIRYKSHNELPPEERNILVQRYLATRPRTGLLEKAHLRKPGGSVDQYLVARSAEKERLIQQFRDLLPKEPVQETENVSR